LIFLKKTFHGPNAIEGVPEEFWGFINADLRAVWLIALRLLDLVPNPEDPASLDQLFEDWDDESLLRFAYIHYPRLATTSMPSLDEYKTIALKFNEWLTSSEWRDLEIHTHTIRFRISVPEIE